MTEWDIQSRSHACTGCGEAFTDKQTYHTLLTMTEAGYQRRDLCQKCHASQTHEGVLSYWQGEYKMPPPVAPEPIQRENAESLLRKLVESTDPTHAAARYILAVMLERKRILKHQDTVTDDQGNELLIYEHAQSGESFTVPDPHLRLDQLADVQQHVAELLSPSAPKAGAEPAAATDAAPVPTAN